MQRARVDFNNGKEPFELLKASDANSFKTNKKIQSEFLGVYAIYETVSKFDFLQEIGLQIQTRTRPVHLLMPPLQTIRSFMTAQWVQASEPNTTLHFAILHLSTMAQGTNTSTFTMIIDFLPGLTDRPRIGQKLHDINQILIHIYIYMTKPRQAQPTGNQHPNA